MYIYYEIYTAMYMFRYLLVKKLPALKVIKKTASTISQTLKSDAIGQNIFYLYSLYEKCKVLSA
jgi:hypothetical protein